MGGRTGGSSPWSNFALLSDAVAAQCLMLTFDWVIYRLRTVSGGLANVDSWSVWCNVLLKIFPRGHVLELYLVAKYNTSIKVVPNI